MEKEENVVRLAKPVKKGLLHLVFSRFLIIGLLLVLLSLSVDTQTYLERRLAHDLLAGSQWVPQTRYTIHFTRIFFGLTIIFLSQIIRIGREMQDEQELTV